MSETIQAKRRFERVQDWLAILVTACILSGAIALLAEGLITLLGLAIGDATGHRNWVDQRLAVCVEWLAGLPTLGLLFAWLGSPQEWLPGSGYLRDLFALVLFVYPLALVPARHIGPTLIARYDDEALRPWHTGDFGLRWAGPLGDSQNKAWKDLDGWCFAGAGTGESPFWRPWALPQVPQPFAIAVLTGSNGVGKSHLAEALCRELDGSLQLAACSGRFASLRLRLRVKCQECLWWRRRHPADPWDSGYLVEDPAARRRLERFLPRRATLIVADELPPESLRKAIEDLNSRRSDFRQPVRLLIVDAALPSTLGLRWEAEGGVWMTGVQELGETPVVDLSDAHFGPPQFRAMVAAQVDSAGEHRWLSGSDREWLPLVEALDRLPVLLAEAIRSVGDGQGSLESLRGIGNVAEQLAERQDQHVPASLPPDAYGKQRELMRERVLSKRTRHREELIRATVGADDSGGEDAYFAILLASLAGGATPARLRKVMNWSADKLGEARLQQMFGRDASTYWVPPIKPGVIADEMLRRYFHAPLGAVLSEETRQNIARVVRMAWLCNPGGTLRTLSRWACRRRRDEFVHTLLVVPAIDQLAQAEELPGMSPQETRAEIARAFFELAVFHDGDLTAAEQAMQALDDEELVRYARLVDALLARPDVRGLPALVLWLQLTLRRWPTGAQLDVVADVRAFGVALLHQAEHLLRQAVVMSVWQAPYAQPLEEALNQMLGRLGQLAEACAPDAEFRKAAYRLSEQDFGNVDLLSKIRGRLRAALANVLAAHCGRLAGEPTDWTKALLTCLASVDVSKLVLPDVGKWLAQEQQQGASQPDEASEASAWANARLLALIARSLVYSDPALTAAAAKRVAAIARDFPHHEGIQYESANAWRLLAWAHNNSDAAATATAADRVATIARDFPRHEGIQLESANAWGVAVSTAVKFDDEILIDQALAAICSDAK